MILSKAKQLLNTICEMGYERKRAVSVLDGLSDVLSQHLFKITAFPDNEEINHWKGEAAPWIHKITKAHTGKKGNKNFNRELLIERLWSEPFGEKPDIDYLKQIMVTLGLATDVKSIKIDMRKLEKTVFAIIEAILSKQVYTL